MCIASDDRPVWDWDIAEESLRPHTSLPDSDDEHQRLMARQTGDAQAAARAQALAQGRRQLPRPGPQLLPADRPRVHRLMGELIRDTRGRRRLSAFPEGEFREAAGILVRYRNFSLEIMMRTQKGARTMFMRDMREVERWSFPELHLLLHIMGHFPPRQLQIRANANGPAYEEIVIPERLREFAVSLRGTGILLKHTQAMANYISLELARGRSKIPAYAPFSAPDVSDAPREIASKEHQADVPRWMARFRQDKRDGNPQSIPMQAWLLYHLGFSIAADIAGDWASFGGLAARLNHLSIAMNIAVTDSSFMALSYDRLVREFLAESPRPRDESAIGDTFFGDFLSFWESGY